MSDLPRCVYCGAVVDAVKGYWILERWENGRVVARGAIDTPGCLHGTGAMQGPRETPLTRGVLPRVEERVIE